jgi:hypothetical protein
MESATIVPPNASVRWFLERLDAEQPRHIVDATEERVEKCFEQLEAELAEALRRLDDLYARDTAIDEE